MKAATSFRRVGILALQGDHQLHADALARLGVQPVEVRTPSDLADVESLVIPGGESTTISRLLSLSAMFDPIEERLADGLPVLGTCAGMILLATEVIDGRPDQRTFGAIDISVRRNAFGRQVESFETGVAIDGLDGDPFPGVFIRAPVVERVGGGVEVLAALERGPVLCRQGRVMVAAFHPELSDDLRLHDLFLATP